MAYKKLKTFKAYGVNQDGTHGGRRAEVDQQIYIEASGACRLFVKVPDYVAGALPGFKDPNASLEKIGEKTAAGAENILVLGSRDPDDLVTSWRKLCMAYTLWVNSQNLHRLIAIKGPERNHFPGSSRGSATTYKAKVALEFTRYLRNEGSAERQHYQWRDDDSKPLEKITVYNTEGCEIVPYTDELWAQLILFQQQIEQAGQRLQDLISKGKFSQRLLAGGQLLLGAG